MHLPHSTIVHGKKCILLCFSWKTPLQPVTGYVPKCNFVICLIWWLVCVFITNKQLWVKWLNLTWFAHVTTTNSCKVKFTIWKWNVNGFGLHMEIWLELGKQLQESRQSHLAKGTLLITVKKTVFLNADCTYPAPGEQDLRHLCEYADCISILLAWCPPIS